MEKEKLNVIVEMAADGTFDCYIADEEKDFGACGYGVSSEMTIQDFLVACNELRVLSADEGVHIPEYDYEYQYDLQSIFEYYKNIDAQSIAKQVGMTDEELSSYLTGKQFASQTVYDKIMDCIHL